MCSKTFSVSSAQDRLPNRSPTFILNQYTTEPDFIKKYSATLNSTPRTFPLTIKNLHVSDSAVYYFYVNPYKNSNSFFTLISTSVDKVIVNVTCAKTCRRSLTAQYLSLTVHLSECVKNNGLSLKLLSLI
uniref:Uncharacterized protein n=1 Tax=Cyprinus carpio TaxID=7962 RepID=A0A8C1WY74_CYPCA